MSIRLDKWLKNSRLIKRRTIAAMACQQGRVFLNDRPAKAAANVSVGDRLHLELGARALTVAVEKVPDKAPSVQEAASLYTILEDIRRPPEKLEWLPAGEEF